MDGDAAWLFFLSLHRRHGRISAGRFHSCIAVQGLQHKFTKMT